MLSLQGASGASAALAARVRLNRAQIAGALLDRTIRRNEITVGAELLAFAFADNFAEAVETQKWHAFLMWVDRMCEKHDSDAPTVRLLSAGIAAVDTVLAGTCRQMSFGAQFAALAEEIRRIAARPRAAAFARVNESLDEVDVALDELMSRLTKFDLATAEHSRAVAMWCARIGKKMALSNAEITYVRRAGLIHDVGKVTTPLDILNAPYRLSEPEMSIMREHAAAGAAIVGGIPLIAHLTPAVRGHHERVDGRGYPEGRAGSDIPLVVRIVSVADSFNAMIGNRPYRLPMAPTLALEQLRVHRDTQFDSNVVAAMIDVVGPQR